MASLSGGDVGEAAAVREVLERQSAFRRQILGLLAEGRTQSEVARLLRIGDYGLRIEIWNP